MANDLFDLYQDAIGDQLVNQASSLLGEPAQSTSAAMRAILPTLIGSLIQKGGTEVGAKALRDFLSANNFDGSLLTKVGGLLSGGASMEGLLSSGGSVLKYLAGDKLGSLVDAISASSLIKTSSASNLLKMTAPLLMSLLGKHIKRSGLESGGVKDYLLSHRALVAESVPSVISDLMGFGSLAELGDGIETPGDVFRSRAPRPESESKPMLNKLLPWLVLLLAALALFYFLGRGCAGAKNRNKEILDATEKTIADNTKTAASTDTQSQIVKKEVGVATSSDHAKVTTAGGTGITQISQALAGGAVNPNTAYVLDNVNFQGKSAVLTSSSETELEQLATILKANPNTHIRIEAHTDNSGDADINKQLSTQQALSVMTFLQGRGIGLNRMSTIGRGQTKPLVPNDTPAGKEQNKRIEIYVVKGN